jgi:hypothetical protein
VAVNADRRLLALDTCLREGTPIPPWELRWLLDIAKDAQCVADLWPGSGGCTTTYAGGTAELDIALDRLDERFRP